MKTGQLSEKGFTLIEVVITLSVIAILGAIMVPLISNNIESAKFARAQSDINTIGKAIVQFRQDLGLWPVRLADGSGTEILVGTGNIPGMAAGAVWTGRDPQLTFDYHLVTGRINPLPNGYPRGPSVDGTAAWNGPYYSQMRVDPWNNAYMVNAAYLPGGELYDENDIRIVWVLSAGSDKLTSSTFVGTAAAGGDDITFRLQ
ncbi:MAG: prepilin-type N-terminal cleavage/methylation domain-containing protein [bacterium]|nr:prepilin-type N-terminal cleavage/methylation domain-containing protein [bacterium]